jgi:hypothetical protein
LHPADRAVSAPVTVRMVIDLQGIALLSSPVVDR